MGRRMAIVPPSARRPCSPLHMIGTECLNVVLGLFYVAILVVEIRRCYSRATARFGSINACRVSGIDF
jgi:hypothetical protein